MIWLKFAIMVYVAATGGHASKNSMSNICQSTDTMPPPQKKRKKLLIKNLPSKPTDVWPYLEDKYAKHVPATFN